MSAALDSTMGVIPVIIVAGAATLMTKTLFDQESRLQQKSKRGKRKSRRRKASRNWGNFSNVGF